MIGRLPRPQAIPVADANALDRHARRTAFIRFGLAACLLAALAFELSLGRDPERRAGPIFPGSKSGVLVADMSASVGSPGRNFVLPLRYLARTRQDFGLILFSDTAYEALPPGTSSTELLPFIRIFSPVLQPCTTPPGYACPPGTRRYTPDELRRLRGRRERRKTPWSESFRGGTRISTGLRLAREVLQRDGMAQRGVLLISDLDTSLFDVPALTRELITYKEQRVPLHIVGLSPFEDDRLYFRRMLGRKAFVRRADLAPRRVERDRLRAAGAFPVDLAALGLLALLLLGLNEHYCGRLTWRRGGGS
jgi:hypothetical protein